MPPLLIWFLPVVIAGLELFFGSAEIHLSIIYFLPIWAYAQVCKSWPSVGVFAVLTVVLHSFVDVQTGRLVLYSAQFFIWLGVHVAIFLAAAWTLQQLSEMLRKRSTISWRQLLDRVTDVMYVYDAQGRILDVNEAASRFLLYSREEFLQMKVTDFSLRIGTSLDQWHQTLFQRWQQMDPGDSEILRAFHRRKDGKIVPIEINFACELEGRKKIFVAISRDITDHHVQEQKITALNARLEEQLEQLRQIPSLLQRILEGAGDLIYMKTLTGHYSLCNQQTARCFGVTSINDVIDQTDGDFLMPEDAARRQKQDQAAFADPDKIFSFEEELSTKENKLYFSTTLGAVRDKGGSLIGVFGISRDMTAIHQAQKALRQSEERMHFALEASETGIWEYFPATGKAYCSEIWFRMLGYQRDAFPHSMETWLDLIHPDDNEACLKALNAHLEGKTVTYHVEHRLKAQDGSWHWILSNGKTIQRERDGKPLRVVGTHTDITYRKQLTATLEDQRNRLGLALEAGEIGVWELDVPNSKINLDERTRQIFGIQTKKNPLIDFDWEPFFLPEDRVAFQQKWNESLQTGSTFDAEIRIIHGITREVRHIHSRAKITRNASHQAVLVLGVTWDVSEPRHLTEKLAEERNRLELAASAAQAGVWEMDFVNDQIQIDNRLVEIWGFSEFERHQLNFANWIKNLHPEDEEQVREAWMEALKSATSYAAKFRIIHKKSEEVRFLRVRARIIRNSSGVAIGAIGINWDVTEEEHAAQTLLEQKARLELATHAAKIGIWEIDFKSGKLHLDRRTQNIFGYSHSSCPQTAKEWFQSVAPQYLETSRRTWSRAVESKKYYEDDTQIIHSKSGEARYVRVRAILTRNEQKEALSAIGVIWDITNEHEASEELRRAKNAAEAGDRAKDAFIASISHELRTPLNGIMGMTELLFHTHLEAQQIDLLSTVRRSGENLLSIINDILDYAKLGVGMLQLHAQPFELAEVIQDTRSLLEIEAFSKDIVLAYDFDAVQGISLHGDAARIKQILINLVGNAIKFTESGSVHLTARLLPSNDNLISVEIEIRDTGIGIPEQVQNRLFQPFKQADQSTSRRFGGTGLGLAISAQIAAKMNGKIRMKSAEGQGSTFWFEFRLPRASLQHASVYPKSIRLSGKSTAFRPLHILLAEDNVINQQVASLMLKKLGHRVTIAIHGKAALELLRADSFDCVLMDCQMPEMDGYEATRQIRNGTADAENSQIPIIALTAAGMPGDEDNCLAAGMNAYALKPLHIENLAAVFESCGFHLSEDADESS